VSCERARVWATLAPDEELAVLERWLLDAHLAHCARCRAFTQDVAAITAELRAAAAEQVTGRVVLPAASVCPFPHRLRNSVSAAAVAAMAFGIALQQPGAVDAPRSVPAPKASPAELEAAELHALRLFRREALLEDAAAFGTPSGEFGNRPT
jgi:hypothetical protein